jgi:hypothetical protein
MTPLAALAKACGWPSILPPHNRRFTVLDDGNPHGLFYLIDPEGTMLGFGSCEGDMDEQRARFIMGTCNKRLDVMAKAETILVVGDRVKIISVPDGFPGLVGLEAIVVELYGQPKWADEPWYQLKCGTGSGALPQRCLEKIP